MWDRLRNTQKDGAALLDKKKLEAWQNSRRASKTPGTGRGVEGGDSQYQYSIKGGPRPQRPPRNYDYPSEHYQNQHNSNYLAAPAVQAPPSAQNRYRSSGYGRPVSSVYSQPSPDAATFAAQQLRSEVAHNDPIEISPPSSPDALSPRDGPNAGNVSPIDEGPDMSQLASSRPTGAPKNDARSSIPTLRRERRKNSDAAINALRDSKSREKLKQPRPYGSDVRWDPRTGEPTTSAKGRPSQVNPHQYVQGLGTRDASASPPQLQPSQPSPNSFSDRARRMRQASSPQAQAQAQAQAEAQAQPEPAPAARPEWRGASGRTTLVAPVNDNPKVAPLNIPPKSSKRAERAALGVLSPVSASESETASSPQIRGLEGSNYANNPTDTSTTRREPVPPTASYHSHQSPTVAIANSSANASIQSYPSPPLSDDTPGPAKLTLPPVLPEQQPQSHNNSQLSLQIPSNDKAIRRKPAGGSGHYPDKSWSSSVYSQVDIHPPQAPAAAAQDDWVQPPSRFSITTYATSQQSSTPRESIDDEAPPVPTPPQQFSQPPVKPAPGSSILDRKRPIVSGFERSPRDSPTEPVKISLESEYYMSSALPRTRPPSGPNSNRGVVPRGANESTLSLATFASAIDKSLPPAPPETQSAAASDPVAQLNAKLQALGNRRININKGIKQMTELMPTDNILASDALVRKREDEKRKVEALRAELAEVERESYDLGLKLHRAYKRMDRDAEYEPTTLWVRRVTGPA
ncbi:hypothetical protein F5B20DRAFT_447884 [Whalleya microplaca]|nr:hypothetical protein F5B20DRAFT_447884 [Whalleya microplaca]